MLFAWVPLIAAADMDGMKTDVSTTVGVLITISIIIVGAVLVISSMRRG